MDGKFARAAKRRLALAVAAAWLSACAPLPPYPPGFAACYERMQRHAADLLPAFAALGYRPAVRLSLDEKLPDPNGLRAMNDVMGDAVPNGRIRLRPRPLCADDAMAWAVVAHEMAHVALQHRGVPGTGLVLEWDGPPQQENEADALGLAALRRIGGHTASERFLECRLRDCGGSFGAATPAFRGAEPRKAPAAP